MMDSESSTIRIALAQVNGCVGDFTNNADMMLLQCVRARDEMQADLIVFPEMILSGYSPEDLLLRQDFYDQLESKITELVEKIEGIDVVFGAPACADDQFYNQALWYRDGICMACYRKQCLPNYDVFDEKRYFTPGSENGLVMYKGHSLALMICEDIWSDQPTQSAVEAGAELIVCINASPFDQDKPAERVQMLTGKAMECGVSIVYVNCVGGQDDLVFDGGSMAIDAKGDVAHHSGYFDTALSYVDWKGGGFCPLQDSCAVEMGKVEGCYRALALGLQDYVKKNQFQGVLIGLSGGIDSALTLMIAIDALGYDRVTTVMMPSQYTSSDSERLALELVRRTGVKHHQFSIQTLYETAMQVMGYDSLPLDALGVVTENIQSRCRGMLLMALSNESGHLVVSTGNKSEYAVGYATLYGDMVGGFCALKDVTKTLVYDLVRYRNQENEVIPQELINRAPTAELSENQYDQDVLPPYDVLDQIIHLYIECDQSIEHIVSQGFELEMVRQVVVWIHRNEYKRRQAPPGVCLTKRAFGCNRRYPMTSRFDVADSM